MATAAYKVWKRELKQSFVKAIDQQAPALQQLEETICQFTKHSSIPKTLRTQNCCSKCPPPALAQACSGQNR